MVECQHSGCGRLAAHQCETCGQEYCFEHIVLPRRGRNTDALLNCVRCASQKIRQPGRLATKPRIAVALVLVAGAGCVIGWGIDAQVWLALIDSTLRIAH